MEPLASDQLSDAVRRIAVAIATAEGFYVAGSLPQRCCNPGDMKLGDRGWGVEAGKTRYLKADIGADIADHTDGFSALRRELEATLLGASHVYTPSDTIETLAAKWTGGDNAGAWARIVAEKLVADPMTQLADLVGAQDGQADGFK